MTIFLALPAMSAVCKPYLIPKKDIYGITKIDTLSKDEKKKAEK